MLAAVNGNEQETYAANSKKCLLFNKIMELHPEMTFSETKIGISDPNKFEVFQVISCRNCEKCLEDPYTLSCGCTFCFRCHKEQSSERNCSQCSKDRPRKTSDVERTNHVVNNILQRYFKKQIQSLDMLIEGRTLHDQKIYSEALEKYESSLKICPENYLAWLNRSKLLAEMKRFEEALEAVRKAIWLKPDYEKAYLEKAVILLELDRNSEAVVDILKCLLINVFDKDAEALLNKAMAKLSNNIKLCPNMDTSHDVKGSNCPMKNGSLKGTDNIVPMETNSAGINNLNNGINGCPINRIADQFIKEMNGQNHGNDATQCSKSFFSKEELDELSVDLECTLCRRVFFEPVTTTCGHVFCKECLTRWLDYNSGCPVCRFSLFQYINIWKMEVTSLIEHLVRTFFPNDVQERMEAREAEHEQLAKVATDTDDEIPIFVCCTALPGRPLQMQIFEPRYRLMLRQCLEAGSKQFGMCTYDRENGFAKYGVMIEVKDVFFVPDGRAFVDCLGGRRFKVLSSGVRDGYNTAKVEWIKDTMIPAHKLDETKNMNLKVHTDVKIFLESLCEDTDYLSNVFNFPGCDNDQLEKRDGPEWVWWLVDNFIRSEELKLMFLSTNSLEERLNLIQRQLCQN